jgi:hypothetical protein
MSNASAAAGERGHAATWLIPGRHAQRRTEGGPRWASWARRREDRQVCGEDAQPVTLSQRRMPCGRWCSEASASQTVTPAAACFVMVYFYFKFPFSRVVSILTFRATPCLRIMKTADPPEAGSPPDRNTNSACAGPEPERAPSRRGRALRPQDRVADSPSPSSSPATPNVSRVSPLPAAAAVDRAARSEPTGRRCAARAPESPPAEAAPSPRPAPRRHHKRTCGSRTAATRRCGIAPRPKGADTPRATARSAASADRAAPRWPRASRGALPPAPPP